MELYYENYPLPISTRTVTGPPTFGPIRRARRRSNGPIYTIPCRQGGHNGAGDQFCKKDAGMRGTSTASHIMNGEIFGRCRPNINWTSCYSCRWLISPRKFKKRGTAKGGFTPTDCCFMSDFCSTDFAIVFYELHVCIPWLISTFS